MLDTAQPVDDGYVRFLVHREQLPIGDIDARPIRLRLLAFPTLRATLVGVAGHPGQVHAPLLEAARRALDSRDLATIVPVYGRAGLAIPDCLGYDPSWGTPTPAEELDLIGSTTPERLAAALDGSPPSALRVWQPVQRDPRRWLDRHHRALVRVWQAIKPFWTQAGGGLEREMERASVAIAGGAAAQLLAHRPHAGPLPPARAAPFETVQIGERGLVLLPQLGGPLAQELRRRDGDALTHAAYPAPGTTRLLHVDRPAASLTALIGPQRTRILRHLDRPRTIGQLAELLMAVPSAATHHTTALERAGLVHRVRRGQRVEVRRTARGTALLALYDDA